SASATTLVTTVPTGATSGHLVVATPSGVGQSSGDFFVPPPGYTAADVAATGRVVMNGSNLTVTVSPANKIGLVVFDGTAGQAVSQGMTAVTITQADITIFRPDGATVITQYTDPTVGRDLHIAALPTTGTYTILIDPRSNYSGNTTLT